MYPPDLTVLDRRRIDDGWSDALANLDPVVLGPNSYAIEGNWRSDPRVSVDREDEMRASLELAAPTDWRAAYNTFFASHLLFNDVDGSESDTLLDCNSCNQVPRGLVAPDLQLVRTCSLLSLTRGVANRDWDVVREELRDLLHLTRLEHRTDLRATHPELAANIRRNAIEATAIQEAVAFIVGKNRTQAMWWAGFTLDIQPLVDRDDILGICRSFGVGAVSKDDVLVQWRYPNTVAGVLYRPTVVEAGLYAYHYPSPTESQFGYTMPLNIATAEAPREVLHAPLDESDLREYLVPKLHIVREDAHDGASVNALRTRQLSRMEAEFRDASSKAWLVRQRRNLL